MDRFRANIVVAGDQPWAEDDWAGLKIGGLEFDSVKPCGRCKVCSFASEPRTQLCHNTVRCLRWSSCPFAATGLPPSCRALDMSRCNSALNGLRMGSNVPSCSYLPVSSP